ncbi:MAG TPA: Gfo/Idh/MocA family oxidoreductase [Planctomicrobium sp.]|nr:Gfo/Idh/MocA family oxidoreductase [Planctomicrobium sp.]
MSTNRKTRVALLGCGQIADAHLTQLKRIRSAEVVAVCDVHEDLAWQAATRFQIPRWDVHLERMLKEAQPDVVHITTPAQTHAPLATQILKAGHHVYVEKPFTLDAIEAEEVLTVAEKVNRFVCVGHDQIFDPAWVRAKSWIKQGLIGDVRHIESILGYPVDGKFGSLVASNPNHWVRRLPGGLFQNTISHPLYRITDLMHEEQPKIVGGWHCREGWSFPTELSLSFQTGNQSGSLTFSTFLPPQRITRVYGTRGCIDIDFDSQTVRFHKLTRLPGAFAKLEAPWQQFGNALWNLSNNVRRFAMADIHYFAGMKTLFERFYEAIQNGTPLPVPHAETYRVTHLMDRIFDHCRPQEVGDRQHLADGAYPRLSRSIS